MAHFTPAAGRLLGRPQRTSLLLGCSGGRRHFHLAGAAAEAVVWTADSMAAVQAAGLAWPLAIPLAALVVNVAVRLPMQSYARGLARKRMELTPLVSAWASRHAAGLARGQGPADARLWSLRLAGLTEKSRRRIYKAWGVQRWKSLAPLLTMAPFAVVSEALRRLCGAPTGWISHSLGLAVDGHASGLFDATLAEGGCLWFVDLTAMDPYYALPLLCSALLARNSWGKMSRPQLKALLGLHHSTTSQLPMSRAQIGLGRALLLLPLFPLLFADLPSAIFLYWATTFALNDVNELILDRLLPRRAASLTLGPRTVVALPYLRGPTSSASQG